MTKHQYGIYSINLHVKNSTIPRTKNTQKKHALAKTQVDFKTKNRNMLIYPFLACMLQRCTPSVLRKLDVKIWHNNALLTLKLEEIEDPEVKIKNKIQILKNNC